MKKIIALFVCTIICLTQVTPALAAEAEEMPSAPKIVFEDDSGFLISMGRLPDEEIESNLPEEMAAAVEKASSNNVSVQRGLTPPNESDVWNLSTLGSYPFEADLRRGEIYSGWVFRGHDGKVKFETRDTSGESGYFVITVYIKDGSGYTWYANCAMNRSTRAFGFVEMNPSALFYFGITAHLNVHTLLEYGNATLSKTT